VEQSNNSNIAAEEDNDILSSIQHGEPLYARIRTSELLSTLLNLSLVSQDRLVDLSIALMRSPLMEYSVFRKPILAAVKRTAYAHFCAGEDVKEASVTLQRMWDLGLRSILDYSLEDAMDNEACDANLRGFLQTVHTSQQLPPGSVSSRRFSSSFLISLFSIFQMNLVYSPIR
jgi:proline dehydrogenase